MSVVIKYALFLQGRKQLMDCKDTRHSLSMSGEATSFTPMMKKVGRKLWLLPDELIYRDGEFCLI